MEDQALLSNRVWIWTIVILVILSINTHRVLAQTDVLPPNPAAEDWILSQVAAGEIADLEEHFPEEAERVISAKFLEQLLVGALVEVPRQGVRIENAVFTEPIDFENIETPYLVWLDFCQFHEPVNLSNSHFIKDLTFDSSTFWASAEFFSMRVDGDVRFRQTVFEAADFDGIIVGNTASFDRATFAGPVDFAGAEIADHLISDDAQFTNSEQLANFNKIKVGEIASFKRATFAGPVDFVGAEIADQLFFTDANFISSKQEASFSKISVGDIAFFNRTTFFGPVNFTGADITNEFVFDNAHFTNPMQTAYFDDVTVEKTAYFNHTFFAGPVAFRGAKIAGQFVFDDARFTNPEMKVDFDGITVGDIAAFNRATFNGPVNFPRATITGEFQFDSTQFTSSTKIANFEYINVGTIALFTNATLNGRTDFSNAVVKDEIRTQNVHFNNPAVDENARPGQTDQTKPNSRLQPNLVQPGSLSLDR